MTSPSQQSSAAATPESALAELRAPFTGTEKLHFNNAGVAPMTHRAVSAGAGVLETMRDGSLGVPPCFNEYDAARATFARVVGAADASCVSFFQTCASAISQVALGFPFRAGDEIVIVDQEYPSNAYPWYRAAERTGARVVVVESEPGYRIDEQRILAALTSRTRVLSVSWVQYGTGSNLDLAALASAAHARGAWCVVDAIQGLGVMPFDMSALGVDAVSGGTQKWLLGPLGHGFLALAPGRSVELEPMMYGAITYGTPDDPVDPARRPRTDARRFEPGTPLIVGAVAGAASAELLLEIGIERLHQEALAVADLVVERARARGLSVVAQSGPMRSPITTLLPKRAAPKSIVDGLRARQCSTAARGGGVRIAPHAHNGAHHVDALFALWDELDR